MNDWRLIQRFVKGDSQEAFAALVRRYTDMVYCTCQRELQDASLAEEAAQAVFLILARKAPSFRSRSTLSSWLFQAAVLTAKNRRRQEQRRQQREQEAAAQMTQTRPNTTPGWEEAEPLLNAALTSLSKADQELIVGRFWEDHSLAEIGSTLGITEDAARMRVNRALNKLRRYFAARSIILSASVLAALLPQAVRPAPAHCAEALLRLLQTPGPTAAGTSAYRLAQGVLSTMSAKRLKLQLGAAALVMALSIGTVGAVRMNSQAQARTAAIKKQADSNRAQAVLDQMYATYAAMHSFKCWVRSRESPLSTDQNATYEFERPNKIRFHRATLLGDPDMSGQALAVSDGSSLYTTCTENKGFTDRYVKAAMDYPLDNNGLAADFYGLPSWGSEPGAGMPNVALGVRLRPASSLSAPEYSMGQPTTIDFSGVPGPVALDVVVARMAYHAGTPGRDWPGAAETVTYYIGRQDHLLYQVIVTDPVGPTEWDTRTETINGMEINKTPDPADFKFTPPPGSHEVQSTSDLFPGGRM